VRPAIELRDVFRVHSTPEGDAAALQGLSLTVADGEVVAVLGPSGSGKTSLLRIVAGLDRPSAGIASVFGLDLAKASRVRLASYRTDTVGYADQHYARALPPELSAREQVALPLWLRGAERRARLRRADALLERVGLAAKRDSPPAELSGGEQQRVAVCAALAHSPKLFLADEPTGELDTASAELVYSLIGELVREQGCTTLIVSHDPGSARIADRVIHIRDGRLAGEATGARPAESIVVGRGGWLRLPEEYLLRAGITSRASARVEGDRIVVSPAEAGGEAAPKTVELRIRERRRRGVIARLSAVEKRFPGAPSPIFAGLSASFEAGRFTAITGPSGTGKTTLLHVIGGLDVPTGGEVEVAGVALAGLDREQRARLRAEQVGFVGQQPGLIGFLSAAENVELGLTVRGRQADDAEELVIEALTAVGLEARLTQRVSRLSMGERARVAIARALVLHPALVLADEPTARLDEANALAVAVLLSRLAREGGTAVVCATHDPAVVDQADDVIALAEVGAAPERRPVIA